jgi:hypothetical protein
VSEYPKAAIDRLKLSPLDLDGPMKIARGSDLLALITWAEAQHRGEQPNPEWEARAKALRDADRAEDPESFAPDTSPEGLRLTARMLDTWFPETFPANEHGQIHFARCMAESASDHLKAAADLLERDQ